MSSSVKFGFRPRALDVTKKLPIRIRKCRKRSPKIKRTVAVAPSGMEKEEEMESHLQQAILAQKATTAGDAVENHVIPTPKVSKISDDEYDRIYQDRFSPKSKKLITFADHVPFFLTQGSYNADSEDEEWLNTRRNVNIDDFEYIIERLESSSQTDIIHPRNARALLHQFNSCLVDDVYDYWLQRRKQAASRKSKCSVLMPRLCTEQRRDEKTINPYTAFRRRLDKVQTRKKQKAELMTYEKMLQINLALKRSIVLVNAIVQREQLKLALVGIEQSLYQLQFKKRIPSEELDDLRHRWMDQMVNILANENQSLDRSAQMPGTSTGQIMPTSLLTSIAPLDSSIPESKCIQRNKELWNTAAIVSPLHTTVFPSVSDDSIEMEKISSVDQNSSVDGRYQFKRKHGCTYRAPIPSSLLNDQTLQYCSSYELDSFRCFSTKFTQIQDDDDTKNPISTGFIRKRLGRGGRVLIDLMRIRPPEH